MQTKRKNKKSLIILGSFLVLAGLTIFGYKYYEYVSELESEDIAIEEFYKEESELAEEESDISQQASDESSKVESPKYDYIAISARIFLNKWSGKMTYLRIPGDDRW